MKRIRLVFNGISNIVGIEELSILKLADADGNRQITVVCEKDMSRQIEMRMMNVPIRRRLLPEVLCTLLQSRYNADMEIIVSDIANGQYRANLYCDGMDSPVPVRISDAVLLSIVSKTPMYIDANLMACQSTPCNANPSRLSMPINALTDEMLSAALEKAIEEEDYELASLLNKEQKLRESTDDIF